MIYQAILLYGLAFWILFTMWRRVKGRSLAELVNDSHHLHQQVGAVVAQHPAGGAWNAYQKWMREVADTQTT